MPLEAVTSAVITLVPPVPPWVMVFVAVVVVALATVALAGVPLVQSTLVIVCKEKVKRKFAENEKKE